MSIQAESNIPMSKDQNSFIQGIKDCVPTCWVI